MSGPCKLTKKEIKRALIRERLEGTGANDEILDFIEKEILNKDEIERAIELYITKKLGKLSENGNTVEITNVIENEIIGKNMLYHEWKDHILPLPEGYDKVKITHAFNNELNNKKIERCECLDLKIGREHLQYTSNLPMLDEDYWQV